MSGLVTCSESLGSLLLPLSYVYLRFIGQGLPFTK
jgi:hypothetical protein